jgi:hypothetical protein
MQRLDDGNVELSVARLVMAGLVPAIHALRHKNVDARDKPGHDDLT